jgi:hypothetical protein
MGAAARKREDVGRSTTPISLDGRGPHEGVWSILAVVMIVVAVLFVLAVVSGSLVEVAPGTPEPTNVPTEPAP